VGTPWGLRVPAGVELLGLAWSCLLFSWPMDMQDGCLIELPENSNTVCNAASLLLCAVVCSAGGHQLMMYPCMCNLSKDQCAASLLSHVRCWDTVPEG
jgi:hypothetical protein